MADPDIDEAKAVLRAEARSRRETLARQLGAEAASLVSELFLNGIVLGADDTIAAYWPVRDELDSRPLLMRLVESGRRVCLPAVVGDEAPLELRLWEPDAPLYESGFGTLAPLETAPVVVPDVVILPLLAFDAVGTRLGYGKGYYDRTLAALEHPVRRIGLAFSGQQVAAIPRAEHDVPLDAVVTEAGIMRFGPETASA